MSGFSKIFVLNKPLYPMLFKASGFVVQTLYKSMGLAESTPKNVGDILCLYRRVAGLLGRRLLIVFQ